MRSVLQTREPVADLVQFSQTARLQSGFELQYFVARQLLNGMMSGVEPVDVIACHGEGRAAHLRLRILNGDQQSLGTGIGESRSMLYVRCTQCRCPRDQRCAIVNAGHRSEQRGGEFEEISAEQREPIGLVRIEVAERAAPCRNPLLHAKRFHRYG